jgi:ferric enterobactin receptor
MQITLKMLLVVTALLMVSRNGHAQTQVSDSTQKLKEVGIIARKNLIKQQADRLSYNLQADPDSKGNNLLTIMRKIPYLSVDGAGNLQLKGSSNFKVLINGKPAAVAAANLKEFLAGLPANSVQRIEVITTPPSKYDAEGLGGLINIVMMKRLDNGYNGTLNVTEEFPVGGPAVGGSFTIKEGKFGLSAFGGGGINHTPETAHSNYRLSGIDEELMQQGRSKSKRKSAYFGTELSYEIDSLNLLSGNINWSANSTSGEGMQDVRQTELNLLRQAYRIDNTNKGRGNQLDAALNYQLGFKADKNRLLTFSYQYSGNNSDLENTIAIIPVLNDASPGYRQLNQLHSPENTMQIDYVHPLKNVMIEAGVKAILRANRSDYQYLSALTDGLNEDGNTALSDLFNNTQQVFAGYNSYALNLKSWTIQAGLRLEKTIIKADFAGNATRIAQDYLRLVPSITFNKNFENHHSLNFGFSQRIKRPGINRLNPFVNRVNPNFESTGNPGLRPVLVNDIQAGYNISGKVEVNIGMDYSFMRNVDLLVSSFDQATQITRSTYANTGKIAGLGNFFTINYPLTQNWQLSLNTQVLYFWIAGEVEGIDQHNNLLTGSTYLSSGYKLNKGWRINAAVNLVSRNPTGFQGRSNGFIGTSFGLNKELIAEKLSFAVSINNPFVKYRDNIIETRAADFYQEAVTQNYFSNYRFSLNYNFGSLKERLKKNKREIRNDDSSN